MATYWKSQPKHHCDFCKCWIADNRPSIDFHERGKRHKENVEKKLKELRQKGQEQYKMQQTLDQDLIKMEQDALKAFKKDLENDPALAAEYRAKAVAAAATEAAAAKQKEGLLQAARKLHKQGLAVKKQPGEQNSSSTQKGTPSTASTTVTAQATNQVVESESDDISSTVETSAQCVWLEGTSPEGDTYYWNSVTGESRWEKPEDYIATDESTAYKNQGVEDAVNETTEQGNSDSNDKQDNSVSDEEQQTVDADSKPAKASQDLLPPGTETEKSEESESDEENEEEPEEELEEEPEEEPEDTETTQKPAKRKMNNPYGSWATIIPDNTPPVDLQLPQQDRPHFRPVVPKAAQFQPRERVKFKERTVTTLSTSSSSSGQTSFKKRKFGGGGRSIRQRDSDT